MCGIIGYIGKKPAKEIVINGLKRLEYRGYDSAGLAIFNGEPRIFKCKGRVKDLEDMVNDPEINGSMGIGHTRWATHGEPNELNAHPQVSCNGNFIVVHNGIIENYARLKKHLEARGMVFTSQTDTEVIANLMEYLYLEGSLSPEQAITTALNSLEGAYGLVIICRQENDKLLSEWETEKISLHQMPHRLSNLHRGSSI
jgi:glucosamine--fructose-6-phosphate aminotransferase (isomerizing)